MLTTLTSLLFCLFSGICSLQLHRKMEFSNKVNPEVVLTIWYWRITFIRWIVLRIRLQPLISNVFGYFGAAHRIVPIRWYIFQRFFTIWKKKKKIKSNECLFNWNSCLWLADHACVHSLHFFFFFRINSIYLYGVNLLYLYENGHSTRRCDASLCIRSAPSPSPLKLDKNQ